MRATRVLGTRSCGGPARVVLPLLLAVGPAMPARAQQAEAATPWGERIAELQAVNREQAALLAEQNRAIAGLSARLDAVSKRLEQLERSPATAAESAPPPKPSPSAAQIAPPAAAKVAERPVEQRDGVGDLNVESVSAGSFAGSILLPGTKGVSLAVGGFVKTAAIADSAAETMGADMLPANLGTASQDTAGNFAIDSTITRLHMDGRADTKAGAVRAYVEYDLNATNNGALGFKLRHAYGTWRTGAGTLTAGHTWSTAMDLRILPDGLTEPTVSGAIFQRQALLRWSFPPSRGGVTVHLAVEDPSGTDIFTNQTPTSRTTVPDFIGAVELNRQRFHLRTGALVRRLELENPASGFRASTTGWGASVSALATVSGDDALGASLTYGDGQGRYLLGLASGSGAILEPDGQLRLRQGGGGLLWYRHAWTSSLRSTVGAGHAVSEVFDEQPSDAFRSSTYAYGNLMWSAMRFATFGAEYSFGRRSTKGGAHLDNHRIMLGIQVF